MTNVQRQDLVLPAMCPASRTNTTVDILFMTGAVKKAIKRNNLNCELSLQDIWFIFSGLTGFGLKRNGAKMMEICYIFDSTIVQHFLFCARLQFLEKQTRVFHSFFVSLFCRGVHAHNRVPR
jgi:hypothetical protein